MVRKDIKEFLSTIPDSVKVVAASKYVGVEDICTLYKNNIKDIGENRVDAFLEKYPRLVATCPDLKFHFIGHLQRNKAKLIVNKIDYLHSLDSVELAKILDKLRTGNPLKCFIEVSINLEENKNGVKYFEIYEFLDQIKDLKNIEIVGLMMMGEKESETPIQEQFHKLSILRDEIEEKLNIKLPYLSMGMSNDYKEAILENATHIRLGRILFDMLK